MDDVTTTYPLVVASVLTIAMAQGAEADFVAFFALRSFGMKALATIVGILATIVTLGLTLGGWLFGILFDRFSNYLPAIFFGAACLAVASLLVLIAGQLEHMTLREKR